jgi:cbb3-type cytochrome oxidase maturation protein
MSVTILLIILGILLAGFFLAAYLWSVSSAQLASPNARAYPILHDTIPLKKNKPKLNNQYAN